MMDKLITLNLEKVCRVCLSESDNTHPIFAQVFSEIYNFNIRDLLTKITDIQLDDSEQLPNSVCDKCLQVLDELSKFQQLCIESNKVIQNYYYSELQLEIYEIKDYIKEEEEVVGIDIISDIGKTSDNDISENQSEEVKGKNRKLYNYYLDTHESGQEEYACNLCTERFKRRHDLKTHMSSHGDRPYTCNECKNNFTDYKNLQIHLKRHLNLYRFKCELCDKKYKECGSLTAHMKLHTNERPFLCPTCGKAFSHKSDFKKHLMVHTGEKRYMCVYCGSRFRTISQLNVHKRTHTGEKPYECRVCSKAFNSSNSLKRHELTHTDLKPYVCSICEKGFNRMSNLNVHVKSHSREKPHSCNICSKRFTQAHSLRGHLKLIHLKQI